MNLSKFKSGTLTSFDCGTKAHHEGTSKHALRKKIVNMYCVSLHGFWQETRHISAPSCIKDKLKLGGGGGDNKIQQGKGKDFPLHN
jgi:hypothetical protein